MEKHIGIVVIGVAALLVGVGVLKLSSKIAMFLIPTSTKDQKDRTPAPIQDVDIEACIEVETHIGQVCDEDVQVTEPVADLPSLPEKTPEANNGAEETKSPKPKKKKAPPKTPPNRGSNGRSETTPPKEEAATGKVGRKR